MNILGLEGGKGMEFEMFGRVIILILSSDFARKQKNGKF